MRKIFVASLPCPAAITTSCSSRSVRESSRTSMPSGTRTAVTVSEA